MLIDNVRSMNDLDVFGDTLVGVVGHVSEKLHADSGWNPPASGRDSVRWSQLRQRICSHWFR